MRARDSGVRNPAVVLVAEDDPEDRILVLRAFSHSGLKPDLRFVNDGSELLDYLRRSGSFADDPPPRPKLILLDLNMPGKDGREALAEIKTDPRFRKIPVIVLTTSVLESDIAQCYDLGANSYIVKPSSPTEFGGVIKNLWAYWFETVRLPPHDG